MAANVPYVGTSHPRQRLCEEGLLGASDRQVARMLRETNGAGGLEAALQKMSKHFEGKNAAKIWAKAAGENCRKEGPLSQASSSVIYSYVHEAALARKVNQMLYGNIRATYQEFMPYVKQLGNALSELPPSVGSVYRLVSDPQLVSLRYYMQLAAGNETVRWHAPALCNTEMGGVGEALYGSEGSKIFFVISNAVWCDVTDFGGIQGTVGRDVVIFASARFSVKSVWQLSEGLHFVHIEMIRDYTDQEWYPLWSDVDDVASLHARLNAAEEELRNKNAQIQSLQARLGGVPYSLHTGVSCGCKRLPMEPHHICSSYCASASGCNGACQMHPPALPQPVQMMPPHHVVPPQVLSLSQSPPVAMASPQPALPNPLSGTAVSINAKPANIPNQPNGNNNGVQHKEEEKVGSCGCRRGGAADHQCVSLCSGIGCDGSCGVLGNPQKRPNTAGAKPSGKKSVAMQSPAPPQAVVPQVPPVQEQVQQQQPSSPAAPICGCKRLAKANDHLCVTFCNMLGCNKACGLPGDKKSAKKAGSKKSPTPPAAKGPTPAQIPAVPQPVQSPPQPFQNQGILPPPVKHETVQQPYPEQPIHHHMPEVVAVIHELPVQPVQADEQMYAPPVVETDYNLQLQEELEYVQAWL